MGAASLCLQLLEHHAVRLKDLFDLSNNFDAPIHLRVVVMHFYSWGDPGKYEG